MSIFKRLAEAASVQGLRFLVIGGHAVIEHGFTRGTEDADLLVCKDDRAHWLSVLEQLGYSLRHDGQTFLQFQSTDASAWPVDLMLVPAETFAKLIAAAKPATIGQASASVPSLEHMIALKAHALKHGRGLRILKDITDVAQLLVANGVDHDRIGFGRHSKNGEQWTCMSESFNWHPDRKPAGNGGPNDFELPDWSGAESHPPMVSKDEWREYCRANLPKVKARPGYDRLRLEQNGIAVEFVM